MTGQLAGAISGGLTVASMIVRMVHDMVRHAISDVIGKLTSKAIITAVSLGTASGWAIASLSADVSSWATRLAKEVTDVVTSAKNLKGLLSKANRLLDDVGENFAGMVATALGYSSKNADNAAKGAKHADDDADAAKGLMAPFHLARVVVAEGPHQARAEEETIPSRNHRKLMNALEQQKLSYLPAMNR